MTVYDSRTGEIVPNTVNPFALLPKTAYVGTREKLTPHTPLEVTITQQSQYFNVKLHRRGIVGLKPFAGGTRGSVTEFSQESRKRMLDTIAKIDRKKVAWGRHKPKFITLTYKENNTDFKAAKRDLKVFIERMQERYDNFSCLWRMEQQEREAIHFHLLCFGMPFVLVNSRDPDKETLQRHWNEVSGQTALNSLDMRAELRSINGVMWYVAKYMAKEDDDNEEKEAAPDEGLRVPWSQMSETSQVKPDFMGLSMPHIFSQLKSFTGRWWGVYGRKNFPYGEKRVIQRVVTLQTMRDLRHLIGGKWARSTVSYTIFGGWVSSLMDVFESIVATRQRENDIAAKIFANRREYARKTWAKHTIALMAAQNRTPALLYKIAGRMNRITLEALRAADTVEIRWNMSPEQKMLEKWNTAAAGQLSN